MLAKFLVLSSNHFVLTFLMDTFWSNLSDLGEEHLKPHVVQGLSNAELYCLALCNLYADPNYSQLSPWGIVQALARKGVYVQAPSDIQLTETVLIQNTPLRISPHMAVIEAMMALQVKEIISNDRIVGTVQRFGPTVHPREMPSDTEEALLLWINRAILAIKDYIQNNNAHEHNLSSAQVESWNQLPLFQDLSDLSDGVGLCSLLAFYCQDELSLNELTVPTPGEPLNVSESLWNLQLVQRVCRDSLPYNVCHFTFEDILYFHESMKQNMLCFLADLFNQLELHPAPNVKLLGSCNAIPIRPGLTSEGVQIRRGYIQQQSQITIPDLRPSLYSYTNPPSTSSSSTAAERNAIRSQSATSTPKRQNSLQDRNRKSSLNIFGDVPSGRRSPSSASVVSVPVRRSGTPLDYNEKAHSDRSNNKDQRYYANSSEDSEEFVVHRGRNVPTLAQVIRSVSPSSQDERSSPASRMSLSRNTSANEEETPAAGRPSNWSANKTTYAGRRSRRNSFSEADSQLTVENFGGSQDNLNRFTIGKNPDKQPAIVTETTASPVRYPRRQSSQEPADFYDSPPTQPAPPQPAQQQQHSQLGTPSRQHPNNNNKDTSLHNVNPSPGDDGSEPVFYGKKKFVHPLEAEDNYFRQLDRDQRDHEPYSGNFNQPQPQPQPQPKFQIQSQYGYERQDPYPYERERQQRQQPGPDGNMTVFVMNDRDLTGFGEPPLRSTSMTNLSRLSDLPNKPVNIVYLQSSPGTGSGGSPGSNSYNNGYGDRRGPPSNHPGEYHTMPNSGGGNVRGPYYPPNVNPPSNAYLTMAPSRATVHDDEGDDDLDTEDIASQLAAIRLKLEEKRKRIEMEKGRMETIASKQQLKLGKAAYLKAINKDLESKWLTKTDEPCRTPEIENMDEYTYQRSLAKMDSSLSELETDINRLASQQQQIQQQRQFFLHGDPPSAPPSSSSDTVKRKTWNIASSNSGSGQNVNGGSSNSSMPSRNQWGPPKPFSGNVSDNVEPPVIKYNGEVRTGNPPFGVATNATTEPTQSSKPPVNASGNLSSGSTPKSSFRLHSNADSQGTRLFNRPNDENEKSSIDQRPTPPPRQSRTSHSNAATVHHAPLPTPPPDDMEPQSVSFVHEDHSPSSTELASIASSKKSLQITSGSKTYRITPDSGSPPRPSAHRLFNNNDAPGSLTSSDENPSLNERGFYIQLDNDGPKRPKPPLRTKSPAKKRDTNVGSNYDTIALNRRDIASEYVQSIVDRVPLPKVRYEEEEFPVYHNDLKEFDDHDPTERAGGELVIDEKPALDPNELDMMEKKKERILLLSLKRQQQAEESRRIKEMEMMRKKEDEAAKADEKIRKREEEKARKQAILESYRLKKQEENEKDGKGWEVQESSAKRFMRPKSASHAGGPRPRPKTIHLSEVDSGANSYNYKPGHGALRRSDSQNSSTSLARSQGKRGSNNTLYSAGGETEMSGGHRDSDSGVGTCSPPQRRTPSPTRLTTRSTAVVNPHSQTQPSCSLPSPSGNPSRAWPGSLPPGLISRRRGFDDGASDISSVASSNMDYSGLRLYKQPTAKSNRSIILNAVEYCVFPGVVNRDQKLRVLDEINRSESKHFLIMFRDAGCQFRALYSYTPERNDEVVLLFGRGPKQVNDRMFEKFFKYNSGGKCFSQVHTKHLTVTIDAFTIHNALWQGKKPPAAKTRDMALVI
ncbi:unnamed protein product [Allacma fusca]|uniref:Patronin n=1 Tax=Allacma fusca TaxID=39272 RepID=A0A8J2K3K1_9HEXA|nr:unnamed protein product [Allacma fusca]